MRVNDFRFHWRLVELEREIIAHARSVRSNFSGKWESGVRKNFVIKLLQLFITGQWNIFVCCSWHFWLAAAVPPRTSRTPHRSASLREDMLGRYVESRLYWIGQASLFQSFYTGEEKSIAFAENSTLRVYRLRHKVYFKK